mgnify:CR=1 FL=1
MLRVPLSSQTGTLRTSASQSASFSHRAITSCGHKQAAAAVVGWRWAGRTHLAVMQFKRQGCCKGGRPAGPGVHVAAQRTCVLHALGPASGSVRPTAASLRSAAMTMRATSWLSR